MNVVKAVNKSGTEIPVVWKTKHDVALRLMGTVGCRLLDQLIEETKKVAVKDKWELNKIEVDYYDDPEVDWEYMMVVLDFGCPEAEAGPLFWDGFLKNNELANKGYLGVVRGSEAHARVSEELRRLIDGWQKD